MNTRIVREVIFWMWLALAGFVGGWAVHALTHRCPQGFHWTQYDGKHFACEADHDPR